MGLRSLHPKDNAQAVDVLKIISLSAWREHRPSATKARPSRKCLNMQNCARLMNGFRQRLRFREMELVMRLRKSSGPLRS